MPRHREGLSRKQTYGISLRDEEYEALSTIGDGSLTAGVSWLMETVLEKLPDKPEFRRVLEVRAAFVKHQEEVAAAKAKAAADLAAAKAAKKAAKGPTKAERELAEAVEHYGKINAQRFAAGEPLYDMTHLGRNPELVAAVYASARAKYGWDRGPRPPGLVGVGPDSQPIFEAPPEPPQWRGFDPSIDTVETSSSPPGPDPTDLTHPGPRLAPVLPGSDAPSAELQESNTAIDTSGGPVVTAPAENMQREPDSMAAGGENMHAGNNSAPDTRPDPADLAPMEPHEQPGELRHVVKGATPGPAESGHDQHQVQEPEF